jgi:transcription elongation factor GreA
MKGAQKLRDELDHLKSVKRPKVIAAIAEAREHGDLKENAEYHAAREEQGFIEGRIKQLEGELSHAEIIDVSKLNAGSKVVFGASVTLADVETDEEKKYQIVGDLEADIKLGLIAISSPVARDDRQAGRRFDRDRRPGRPARVRDRQRQLRGLTRWQRRPCCCRRAAALRGCAAG